MNFIIIITLFNLLFVSVLVISEVNDSPIKNDKVASYVKDKREVNSGDSSELDKRYYPFFEDYGYDYNYEYYTLEDAVDEAAYQSIINKIYTYTNVSFAINTNGDVIVITNLNTGATYNLANIAGLSVNDTKGAIQTALYIIIVLGEFEIYNVNGKSIDQLHIGLRKLIAIIYDIIYNAAQSLYEIIANKFLKLRDEGYSDAAAIQILLEQYGYDNATIYNVVNAINAYYYDYPYYDEYNYDYEYENVDDLANYYCENYYFVGFDLIYDQCFTLAEIAIENDISDFDIYCALQFGEKNDLSFDQLLNLLYASSYYGTTLEEAYYYYYGYYYEETPTTAELIRDEMRDEIKFINGPINTIDKGDTSINTGK